MKVPLEKSARQFSVVASAQPRTYRAVRAVLVGGMFSLAGYGLASYGALSALWKFYETRHPALALAAPRAFTPQGIPGDPILRRGQIVQPRVQSVKAVVVRWRYQHIMSSANAHWLTVRMQW